MTTQPAGPDQHVRGVEIEVADAPRRRRRARPAASARSRRNPGSGTLTSISSPSRDTRSGRPPTLDPVALQLECGEIDRPGARPRLARTADTASSSDGPSTRSRIDAGAPVHGDRAVRPGHRQPRLGQVEEHGRLVGGQAVPLGPVELEHPTLAVGEDLGRTALGQQLHAALSPAGGPATRRLRPPAAPASMAGVVATSNASGSSGPPGPRVVRGRGTRWTWRWGTPLPRLSQFIFAGRYCVIDGAGHTGDVRPEARRLLGRQLRGLGDVPALPDDVGIAGPDRIPAEVAVGPGCLRRPADRAASRRRRARTSGTPRRGAGRRSRPATGVSGMVSVCLSPGRSVGQRPRRSAARSAGIGPAEDTARPARPRIAGRATRSSAPAMAA